MCVVSEHQSSACVCTLDVCVCFTYTYMQCTGEVHTLRPIHDASCQHKGMCEAVYL